MDAVVLLTFGVLIFTAPPDLQYFGFKLGLAKPFWPNPLGGLCTGLAVAGAFEYYLVPNRWLRRAVLASFALAYFVLPSVSDMGARREFGLRDANGRQTSWAHDGGVLQTEAAIEFLLRGQSPYSADYGLTEMAKAPSSTPRYWQSLGYEDNPAYQFFPYPPLTLLASIPVRAVCKTAGWYDQRVLYLVAYLFLVAGVWRFPCGGGWRPALFALAVISPFATAPFTHGHNDVLCTAALVWAFALLGRDRTVAAGVALGLACGFKQFAWPFLPFFLLLAGKRDGVWNPRAMLSRSWPMMAIGAMTFLPFLLWDPRGLVHGLVTAQSSIYPIQAVTLGFTNFLTGLGLIDGPRSPYFAVIPYLLVVLPVFVWAMRAVWRRPSSADAVFWYGVTLTLFLFFSRHFDRHYLWLIVTIFACHAALAGASPLARAAESHEGADVAGGA
ncbi:DUF2029 domain-containing protein [Candidatus Poribacteria bacterium]|nr:DUF2029 domain-containing protein [Candidatus Poribacteria bacterium]